MAAIFAEIWRMSLFLTPVILVAALLSRRLGARYGVRWRYLLWLALAVRLCLPLSLELPGRLAGMQMEMPAVQTGTREILAARTVEKAERAELQAPVDTQTAPVDRTQPPSINLEADSSYQNPVDFLLAYPEWLWAGGVALYLSWHGAQYAAFLRMLHQKRERIADAPLLAIYATLCGEMGMKRRPPLYLCAGLPSPLCIGFLRPAVYLNSVVRREEDLRMILKHELMHCKRHDLWGKGLFLLAQALHFFNPCVHGLARLAERDMEYACDATMMQGCDMQEREAYSMAILRTVQEEKQRRMRMSTAFSGGKEALQMRFTHIFDRTEKKRGLALFMAVLLLIGGGTAFVGCGKADTPQKAQTGVLYGDYTEEMVQQLYEAKLDFIGNHVGVGKIMGLLPLPDGITADEEGMELFTDATPYGAKRHLNSTADRAEQDDCWFRIHAMIFLALVENADYFGYDIHTANGVLSWAFDLDGAKYYFGEADLKQFAADAESFHNFVLALNQYFYEGMNTQEEREALMQLDAAAAQARMEEMLSGAKEAADMSGKSISYQMIYADSLVYEIAVEQAGLSSNPLDDTNCEKYEELVKIGEPALRKFLNEFAAGQIGDTLEGYLMMYACQDILGEARQAEVTPTEWFAAYFAQDSTVAAKFHYDAAVYPADLAEEYSLGDKDVDKWSIVAAGADARLLAVYDALEERYAFEELLERYKTVIFAPDIHKIVENGDNMQVFATVFEQKFVLTRTKEGAGFFDIGGSVIPTRMDFIKEDGVWRLVGWTEAEDGSRYTDSIKEMCAGHIGLAQKMLGAGKVQELMWQNMIYYMQAQYGGMEISVYTTSYVDEGLLADVKEHISLVTLY